MAPSGQADVTCQLGPVLHTELPERLAKVVLDGLGAEEEGRRRLFVRRSVSDQQRDLQFLFGERRRRVSKPTPADASGAQHAVGSLQPGTGAAAAEDLGGAVEGPASEAD